MGGVRGVASPDSLSPFPPEVHGGVAFLRVAVASLCRGPPWSEPSCTNCQT